MKQFVRRALERLDRREGHAALRIVLASAGAVLALAPSAAAAKGLIRVVSSRPDTVSGGDALLAVPLPKGALAPRVKVTVDGGDATSSFKVKGARWSASCSSARTWWPRSSAVE